MLAIEPSGIGDAVVTASVGQLLGDASGTLKVTNRRVVGEAQPTARRTSSTRITRRAPPVGTRAHCRRHRLRGAVEPAVLPEGLAAAFGRERDGRGGRRARRGAADGDVGGLTVHGTLSGVEQLAIAWGRRVVRERGRHIGRGGHLKVSGVYEMRRLVVDGSSTLTVRDGVPAHADSLEVVDGSIKVHGAVALSAAHMNMTADGEIDGSARATANLDRTSAGWPKNGPTSHFHRVAAGHGGQPGQWGQGTMYGSTFEPVTQGSSGNGASARSRGAEDRGAGARARRRDQAWIWRPRPQCGEQWQQRRRRLGRQRADRAPCSRGRAPPC